MDFKLNDKGINTNTVSITDYKMVSAKVAKVVVAFTGRHTKESLVEALSEKLKYAATAVENSFRMVKAGVAVGYLRANTELLPITDQEIKASYRVMASNILMDNKDKTLWELREGAGGKYLARHGNEDLSELVNASVHRRQDTPRLSQLTMASAAPREFVAFASASGDMDYGFCVASGADRLKVVSAATGKAQVIPFEAVASVVNVKIPKKTHERITAAGINRADKDQQIEYYSRLYSYDREYLTEVIRQVEDSAVM